MPAASRLLHSLQNRKSGLSIIEMLISAFILTVLLTGLFLVLNTGEFSSNLSSAQADLQGEVRRTMDWIARDVRQAVSWEIAKSDNNPTSTHIRFKQVEGWNVTGDTYLMSSNYVEYTYDNSAKKITRRLSNSANATIKTWGLNNIVQAPFYTRDDDGDEVGLNGGALLNSKKIIIKIYGQKQARGSIYVNANLTEEVKIRNE